MRKNDELIIRGGQSSTPGIRLVSLVGQGPERIGVESSDAETKLHLRNEAGQGGRINEMTPLGDDKDRWLLT